MNDLSEYLDLIAILQIINNKESISPAIKNIKGIYYFSIKEIFVSWLNYEINSLFEDFCKTNDLSELYERVINQKLDITPKDRFYYVLEKLFATNEYKLFCSNFTKENLHLKKKLENRFIYFNSPKIKNELEKIGINSNNLIFIPNNFSQYSYITNKNGIIYLILGDIAGLDELEYSTEEGIANDIFTFYLLSRVFISYFNILESIKFPKKLKKYLLDYCFISEERDISSFFFLNCIYAYTLRFLNYLNIFDTGRIENILLKKGFIAPIFYNLVEQQNSNLDLSKVVNFCKTKEFKKFLKLNFPTKRATNNVVAKIDSYDTNKVTKINHTLRKILKESDCLMLGEVHFCKNYYNFINKLIPFFVEFNYINFYFELPASYNDCLNKYINNKTSFPKDKLLNSLKPIFTSLRNIQKTSKSQIKIICFDILLDNNTAIDNYRDFLIDRENQIINNLHNNLKHIGKNIFFTGKAHVFKQTKDFYMINTPCLGIFLNDFYKSQRKKLYSFIVESNFIETNYCINSLNKRKIEILKSQYNFDLIAKVQKKCRNRIALINLANNKSLLGWYEKDSLLFDGDISNFKSEGYFIHEPENLYDGLIIFPELKS